MPDFPDFDRMSREEQKEWWYAQANHLCEMWQMADAMITWSAFTHNAVFDVQYAGVHYILRLHRHSDEAARAVHTEMELLTALSSHLCVPVPVHAAETEAVIGLLLDYVEGTTTTPDLLLPFHCRKIGAYLAALHQIEWEIEMLEDRRRCRPDLDYDGLLGDDGVYALSDDERALFSDDQWATMQRAGEHVREAMQILAAEPGEAMSVIHGDLLLPNIIFQDDDTVCAIDWEYATWGYRLYDLTPLLWHLRPQPNYAELEDALWQGYTANYPGEAQHRELLQVLMVGRQIASMRWVVQNRHLPAYRDRVEDILSKRTGELQHFLDTGEFRRT